MMNTLLNVIFLATLVGTFVAFAPAPESRPAAPRPSATNDAAAPPGVAGAAALSSQQPPIPLVRSQRAMPAVATAPDAARTNETARQPQDDVDKTAAKAAIEADGYKGVTVLAKGADGTWRAKAYRGKTEVQLTVDGAGRVSTQ